MDRLDLEHRMGYHKMSDPKDIDLMAQLRERYIDLGDFILTQVSGDPRSVAVAITSLEESLMWAVKALALESPLELGK